MSFEIVAAPSDSPFARGMASLPTELHDLISYHGIHAALGPLPTDQRRRLCGEYGDPLHSQGTRSAENKGKTPCSDSSYQLLDYARGEIMNVTPPGYPDQGAPYYQKYDRSIIIIGNDRMGAREASMFEICGCQLDIEYKRNKETYGWTEETLRQAKKLRIRHLKHWQERYEKDDGRPFVYGSEEWHTMLTCACEANNADVVKFLVNQFVDKFRKHEPIVDRAPPGKLLSLGHSEDLKRRVVGQDASDMYRTHSDFFYKAIFFVSNREEDNLREIIQFFDECLNLPWPWPWELPNVPVRANAAGALMHMLYRTNDPRIFRILFRSFLRANAGNTPEFLAKTMNSARFLVTRDRGQNAEQFREIIVGGVREILRQEVNQTPLNEEELDSDSDIDYWL